MVDGWRTTGSGQSAGGRRNGVPVHWTNHQRRRLSRTLTNGKPEARRARTACCSRPPPRGAVGEEGLLQDEAWQQVLILSPPRILLPLALLQGDHVAAAQPASLPGCAVAGMVGRQSRTGRKSVRKPRLRPRSSEGARGASLRKRQLPPALVRPRRILLSLLLRLSVVHAPTPLRRCRAALSSRRRAPPPLASRSPGRQCAPPPPASLAGVVPAAAASLSSARSPISDQGLSQR